MSASGTKQTSCDGDLMSAFRGNRTLIMSDMGHERRLTQPAATSVSTLNADIFLRCNI